MKEDFSRQNSEQKSPILHTFYEAKQNLIEYGEPLATCYDYIDSGPARVSYLESAETAYLLETEQQQQQQQADMSLLNVRAAPTQQVRSTESFLNDSSPDYFHPEEYIRAVKRDRTRRRRSKEMIEAELIMSSNDDEPKRKPEAMRSISEDSGGNNKPEKPVTRRSLSHPEREKEVGFQ